MALVDNAIKMGIIIKDVLLEVGKNGNEKIKINYKRKCTGLPYTVQ